MKKLSLIICICLIISMLCACGSKSADIPEDTAAPEETVAPEETAAPEKTAAPEETTAPEKTAAPEENGKTADASAFVGNWHDSIAGRASMSVTLVDGQLCFDVLWPDSAAVYYVFTFAGTPDAEGKVEYVGGFKGIVECDEQGNETKTILSEDTSGTVTIADDGSMVWTESEDTSNPHIFLKN